MSSRLNLSIRCTQLTVFQKICSPPVDNINFRVTKKLMEFQGYAKGSGNTWTSHGFYSTKKCSIPGNAKSMVKLAGNAKSMF